METRSATSETPANRFASDDSLSDGPVMPRDQPGTLPARKRPAMLRWVLTMALVAVIAWAVWRQSAAPSVVRTEAAEVGVFWTSFTAEGVVRGTEYTVGAEAGGRVIRLTVREGDAVTEGQVLLFLNADQPRYSVAEMEAALQSALADVARAQRERVLLADEFAANLSAARARVRQAELEHQRLLSGSRPEEVEQAAQRTLRARAAVEESMRARDRAAYLYQEGAIPLAALDRAEASHREAVADLKATEAAERLVRSGPRAEEVEVSLATIEAAKADVVRAQSEAGRLAVAAQAVVAAQHRADQARAARQRAESAVQDQVVTAPSAGTVTKLLIEQGAVLAPGAPAIVISTRKDLRVEAEVSTEDTPKLDPGMEVSVTAAAYPGRAFRAQVQDLMPSGELKPDAAIRTRIVRARIRLLEVQGLFRPGMEVDIEGKKPLGRRLSVPTDCVRFSGESASVLLIEDGKAVEHPVRIGIQNPDRTEIVSGLQVGQRVIIRGKDELTSGTPVRTVRRE